MSFAAGSGTYTGNFISLLNNNTTAFQVTSTGVTSIGLGATASTNAVCSSLANTTAPTSGVAYELRDCNAAPAADYAEMYPVNSDVGFGDIVAVGNEMVPTYDTTDGNIDWTKPMGDITKLIKSDKEYQSEVIGVVSDNYGDFSSTGNNIKKEDNPMPVALNGRVPVKISNSSEAINAGDYITTSAENGKAEKATKAGEVIGKALTSWTPNSGQDTVMIFIEQGYYDGPNAGGVSLADMQSLLDINAPTVDSSGNETFVGKFFDRMKVWLADAENGIGDLYAKKIHTEQICVKKADGTEFCADGDQLEKAVSAMTGGTTPPPTPTPPTCVAPQILNSAGDACIDPIPTPDPTPTPPTCVAPQILNSAGDACVDPIPTPDPTPTPPTCVAPQILNSTGDACVDPAPTDTTTDSGTTTTGDTTTP